MPSTRLFKLPVDPESDSYSADIGPADIEDESVLELSEETTASSRK